MADYAHMSRIKIISPDEMLKLRFDRWVEAQKRPYAKLMSGFYKTKYLINNLKEARIDFSSFATQPDIKLESDIDEESKFSLEPAHEYCEGAFFTPKSFVYPPYRERTQKNIKSDTAEQFAFVDKLSLEVKKLHELGCSVIFPAKNRHRCEIDDPARGAEYLPGIDLSRLKDYERLGIPVKRQSDVQEFIYSWRFISQTKASAKKRLACRRSRARCPISKGR